MTRLMTLLMVVGSLCIAASAGVNPGSISGYVRDSAGVPQMGATVEVANSAAGKLAYTDAKGFFSLAGLVAGNYNVHVSAPSFLPTLREDVSLAAGASKVLNITLKTLFEAMRMLPPMKNGDSDDDSWRWTLRSTANRPILRFDADSAVVVETAAQEQPLKASVALMAGAANEGYGSGSDLAPPSTLSSHCFTPAPSESPATWDTATEPRTAWFAPPIFAGMRTDITSRWL